MIDDRILAAYNKLASQPKPDRREVVVEPDFDWLAIGVNVAEGPVSPFGTPVHVSPLVPPGEALLVHWGDRPLFGPPVKFEERAIPDAFEVRLAMPLIPPRSVVPIFGAWDAAVYLRPGLIHRPKYGRGGRRKRARRNARRG